MKYTKMTNKNLKKRCVRGDSRACHTLKKRLSIPYSYRPRGKRQF